mgnify:CR=1 FL=1
MSEEVVGFEPSLETARALVDGQFPGWAGLPLVGVPSGGTDHTLYRLGQGLVVRFPRAASAVAQADKEWAWLPKLAPGLPLRIPAPVARGEAAEGYPLRWSVCPWVEGVDETQARFARPGEAAERLGAFVAALQGLDATGGPPPGQHNFGRGVPLAQRDVGARESIEALVGVLDAGVMLEVWEDALAAPVWDRAPVWLHGDLHPGNVVLTEGRLASVIDFGGLGVGDPACDVMAAWTLFEAPARARFRAAVGVDEACWRRGRGWALSFAAGALSYYMGRNPVLAGIARRTLERIVLETTAAS